MTKLLDVVRSKRDSTVKFVFMSKGQIIEFSYINKNDGKDIICASTQTGCKLGCQFCYLSDCDLVVRNLLPSEIVPSIDKIISDLGKNPRNNVLLVSYMGCGEPLYNLPNVVESSLQIREQYSKIYDTVRFAVASLVPYRRLMLELINHVQSNNIKLKFHLSLHSPNQEIRQKLMPAAWPIKQSLDLVEEFMYKTGNNAEIHYALMENINDRDDDLVGLTSLLRDRNIPVKFIAYNKKPTSSFCASQRVEHFRNTLGQQGIITEYYEPPGSDIGSSCGQFLMEYYDKYNSKNRPSLD